MKTDMTKGNITNHLAKFALPLILGNIFQLTYNAVDSIIVGRFVGDAAQAAIGTANPIMNIAVFFIVGICTGTSVLMSEYFGAQDYDKLRKEIGTAMSVGIIFTAVLSIICMLLSRRFLILINTPDEILDMSTGYLQIVFGGLLFTFLYNIYAGTMRSIGDARTPIYFVAFSALLNVFFDLLFVVYYKLGVHGAAIGTILSEMISAILCVVYVHIKMPMISLKWKDLRIDKKLLKDTVNYSWSTGMQKITLNVGKVLIQAFVNDLGVASIAAFNAANRVDDFVFQPQQSIASSMTTFVAQNRGAKKPERIRKSFLTGMLMETAYWIIIGTIVWIFSEGIMYLFVGDTTTEVARLGIIYLRTMAFFYILPGMTNGLQGYMRGWGKMNICLASTFVQIVGRIAAAAILIPRFQVAGISYSCLVGWLCMLSFEIPFYLRLKKTEHQILGTKGKEAQGDNEQTVI